MAESEKLRALKKAYADIILNTAKEAAARIMLSEKRAQRYQRELFAAKDESLCMLLRLKQMLDAKVNEAEMASLSQQRRIEELEAQLGEAEDIVKDLRAELRELQDELEKVMSSQMQPLGECNSEGENATLVTAMEENKLSTSGYVISYLPASQCDPVITLETKNSNFNSAWDGNKCYGENDCSKDNCFACNPDFASIVMRNKEPELYRNGCTQRIRASERNLLGGMSLSGQSDGVKNQIFIGEDEEGKDFCKLAAKVDNFCDVERIGDVVKDIEAGNRIRKRRRKTNPSLSVQGVDMKNKILIKCAKADITSDVKRNPVVAKNDGGIPRGIRRKQRAARCRRHREYKGFLTFPLRAVDNNVQIREDYGTIDNISLKNPEPLVEPISSSNTHEMIMQSGSEEYKEETEFGRTCLFQDAPSNDKLSIEELELTGQDAVSALSSEFPTCKTDFEAASVLLSDSDPKEPGANESVSVQPVNNKFLKYTFQRKREKQFPSCPDGDSSLEDSTLGRKMEEKQNGSMELQKSGIITESSRENRRLAQVARQLISLSEKKWR